MIHPSKAVITGDIVDSREMQPNFRQAFFADLNLFFQLLRKEKWISMYEVTRGDSFQCLLDQKSNALRVALIIRTFVQSYTPADNSPAKKSSKNNEKNKTESFPEKTDVRLAIGIGEIDIHDKKSLSRSDGEAFWLSGNELETLKKLPYRMIIRTFDTKFNESIEPTMLLLDALVQRWTSNQAASILYKLRNFKEEEISKEFNISQPAVNQRIRTAQWYAVEKLLSYFENLVITWK